MTEQQRYDVVGDFPGFELRRYAPHLVAEVEVEGSFTEAGNRAFGIAGLNISSPAGSCRLTCAGFPLWRL